VSDLLETRVLFFAKLSGETDRALDTMNIPIRVLRALLAVFGVNSILP
jgi:hypothetical protein